MRRRRCRGLAALSALAIAVPTPTGAAFLPDTIRLGRLSLDYATHRLTMRRLEIGWPAEGPIALSADRLEGPAGIVPLWASARLAPGPPGPPGPPGSDGWTLTGVVASGPGDLVLRFDGQGLGGEVPRLVLESEPLRFAPDGLQPAGLWPPAGAFAREVEGTLRLALTWPEGPLVLEVEGVRMTTDYGPVGPIDGRVSLERPWPPRTAEPQLLRVEGLRLAPLVDGLEIADLGAEGTIDADLRFAFDEAGRLLLDDTVLRARGPGVLRYRADRPPDVLAGQGQGVELLFTALADFRYESLRATLNGYLDDDLTVQLQLRGANPELYEGHPIELNVNLEAPILPLALAGRDVMALPDAVRRALGGPLGGPLGGDGN